MNETLNQTTNKMIYDSLHKHLDNVGGMSDLGKKTEKISSLRRDSFQRGLLKLNKKG
jgi:hypothetical protein